VLVRIEKLTTNLQQTIYHKYNLQMAEMNLNYLNLLHFQFLFSSSFSIFI